MDPSGLFGGSFTFPLPSFMIIFHVPRSPYLAFILYPPYELFMSSKSQTLDVSYPSQ